MTTKEMLKKLDCEISKVIQEVEDLKNRLKNEWKKEKSRKKIKTEIENINVKIQEIFEKIIEITK